MLIKDFENIRRELEFMATNLIGETVKVYLRDPAIKGFLGHAYRDSMGVRVIDISPSVKTLADFYEIALHECGHHAEHVVEESKRPLEIEDLHKAEGAFYELTPDEVKERENDPRESEADNFMRGVDRIAQEVAHRLFGNDSIMTRIRVLKEIRFLKGE